MENTLTTNSATTTTATTHSNQPNKKKANLLTKVDVYSFAIVMWELLFEKTPFLEFPLPNHANKNNNNRMSGSISTYRVPILVSKGERPQILENEDEIQRWLSSRNPKQFPDISELTNPVEFVTRYIQLMKSCWDQVPQNRPSFSKILKELEELMKMFK